MARDIDPRRLIAAHAAAAAFYRERLPGHLPALAYLHSRGVPPALANRPPWTVGYAPAGWTELRTVLHAAGFADRELLVLACLQADVDVSRDAEQHIDLAHGHRRVALQFGGEFVGADRD